MKWTFIPEQRAIENSRDSCASEYYIKNSFSCMHLRLSLSAQLDFLRAGAFFFFSFLHKLPCVYILSLPQ